MPLYNIKRTALIFCCCLGFNQTLVASQAATNSQASIAPMLHKVLPSVVQIMAEVKPTDIQPEFNPGSSLNNNQPPQNQNDSSDPSNANPNNVEGVSFGTGIVFDAKNGFIVTNAHVVKDSKLIMVTLKNGNRYYGDVVAKEPKMDIAVLHINAKGLHALPLASMKDVHIGDLVAAIGSPFGLTQSVTRGSISALNRSQPTIGDLSDFIQTDASMNPGNSGGPLVNMQGQMIGINTAIIGPANVGLGFAIPVNIVRSAAEQLIKYGNIKKGMLGVVVQPLAQDVAQALHSPIDQGALVNQVYPGSAADKAGLRTGDIIESIAGLSTDSAFAVQSEISLHRPGSKISIVYWHDGKQHTTTATVGSAEDAVKNIQTMPFVAGLQLQNINGLSSAGDLLKGLLVSDVKDHSSAMLAGIQPGDIIVAMDRQTCDNIQEMKQTLAIVPENQPQVLVKLYRDGKFMYVALTR